MSTQQAVSKDSFKTEKTLSVGGKDYTYWSLPELAKKFPAVEKLPFSLKVLLENLLRREDGLNVPKADIEALANWNAKATPDTEISFMPARVLLQDFTGVPAVVDLAAMRDAMVEMGGDPNKINPLRPADLVIDHSVQIDQYGTPEAFAQNVKLEYERNKERYQLLRWAQESLDGFRVVPPGAGIVHQINIEYLAKVVFDQAQNGQTLAYPDSLVGTDSHTTMINGLGVLGWGVGGIEAEAAMLGQAVSMLIPQVVGFKLTGRLKEGVTATDLVLTVTEMLRKKGVVGKFVEFYGQGLSNISLADRATVANMSPEYGATMGFFPVDDGTLEYLRLSSRDEARVKLVEEYCKAQGLFRTDATADPVFTDTLELDLGTVEPSIAGPKRPQDRIALQNAKAEFGKLAGGKAPAKVQTDRGAFDLAEGAVVIAAITSCTNTSNPRVMLGAGILARKAAAKGLKVPAWVKTSLAPGSKVVTDYLKDAGVLKDLETLGFYLVGYGCTTCIGNSGPLAPEIEKAVDENKLVVAGVLSGNRNFEGRVSPHTRANYLASPPLVVAYALAGNLNVDLTKDPIGKGSDGKDVYLKDIWPTHDEVEAAIKKSVRTGMFTDQYGAVFDGDAVWRGLDTPKGERFDWAGDSTYIRKPSFFEGMGREPEALSDIKDARCLALLGDSVTTDHISPAGKIPADGAAARYLKDHGIAPKDWNSFGSRRGNHEVMMRGTFGNIRLKNQLAPGTEGSWTTHIPSGEKMSIYDASMKYQAAGTPLIVLGGKEYGTGSSRDWAAKGTILLGVKAVLVESFERIHRSNLVGMGVLPLQFKDGDSAASLGLKGDETFSIEGVAGLKPGCELTVAAGAKSFKVLCRIDTPQEVEYYRHGGILQYVLRGLL